MESIELIRQNLERSRDHVLGKVEDMRRHGMVAPTPNGGGHTIWILGHLAYVEHLVIDGFVLGTDNSLADWEATFDGGGISGVEDDFPPFDDVLAACREARRSTLALVDSLTETDLDAASAVIPRGFEDTFGTYRSCLQYMADHWYMHRGQLADARRAAGVDRMWV